MENLNLQQRNGSVMNKSESINELAMALSKLQGEVSDAVKDTQGHGYKHATLTGVLEIARPLLHKYGLALAQLPGVNAHDSCVESVFIKKYDKNPKGSWEIVELKMSKLSLETVLMHSSGQWISSCLTMSVQPSTGNTLAQSVGAVITYARRYASVSILGISQIDDDAVNSSSEERHPSKFSNNKNIVEIKPIAEVNPLDSKISSLTLNSILDLMADLEVKPDGMLEFYKVKKLDDLTERQGLCVVNKLKKMKGENNEMQG